MAKLYTQSEVAKMLKAALDKHGLKQADLARLLGVHPQSVSLSCGGFSISPKVAAWLGFERHHGIIYQRREGAKAEGKERV